LDYFRPPHPTYVSFFLPQWFFRPRRCVCPFYDGIFSDHLEPTVYRAIVRVCFVSLMAVSFHFTVFLLCYILSGTPALFFYLFTFTVPRNGLYHSPSLHQPRGTLLFSETPLSRIRTCCFIFFCLFPRASADHPCFDSRLFSPFPFDFFARIMALFLPIAVCSSSDRFRLSSTFS